MRKMWQQINQSGLLALYRKMREAMEDKKQNRELVGEDRFGNRYYQYYSFFGLPTRREIRFKHDIDFAMKDLVYYQWLHHQRHDPPTQAEKQQFYLEQKIRHEKALEWDRKEELVMLQFRRQRQQLQLRDAAMKQIQLEMKKTEQLQNIKTKRDKDES